jgi:hypothetical protein
LKDAFESFAIGKVCRFPELFRGKRVDLQERVFRKYDLTSKKFPSAPKAVEWCVSEKVPRSEGPSPLVRLSVWRLVVLPNAFA